MMPETRSIHALTSPPQFTTIATAKILVMLKIRMKAGRRTPLAMIAMVTHGGREHRMHKIMPNLYLVVSGHL